MVDPSMPWSLKGISNEAREFAKQSADGSHIPVGTWLSAVIRSAAAQEAESEQPRNAAPAAPPQPSPSATPPAPESGPGGQAGGTSGGSTIERAAQFVDEFDFEPEGPAHDVDLISDPSRLQEELLALERRLEESETTTDENIAPLIEEIERVKTRLDAIKKH